MTSIKKSVTVLDNTWIVPLAPQPTTVVAAMFCPAEKLTLDVPGYGPLGHAAAKPALACPEAVRLNITALAVAGTPLPLAVVSMVRAVLPWVGDFCPTAAGGW